MTTVTQTSLIASGAMPAWNPFRVAWPSPEDSICESYTWQFPVKSKKCWSIQGHAREVYGPIRESIQRCVEERGQDIFEGADESYIPHSIHCFMVGSTKARARPYVVISCKRYEVSKRLMTWVKSTQEWRDLINHNPGFGGFILLNDAPRRIADDGSRVQPSLVYGSSLYTDICGAPISFSSRAVRFNNSRRQQQARAGNIMYLDDIPFGLTVAHPLADQENAHGQLSTEGDLLFYMDDSDEDCSITSDVSSSTKSNAGSGLFSTCSKSFVEPHPLPEPRLVGRLVCSSPGTPDDAVDWALFAIHPEYLNGALWWAEETSDPVEFLEQYRDRSHPSLNRNNFAMIEDTRRDYSESVLTKKPSASVSTDETSRAVFTQSRNENVRLGVLDGNESLVWLAGGHKYMSLQTLIMEDELRPGDCGIWAFNREGTWLGHIVAGIPGTKTAYLAQASEILLDIQKETGMVASHLPGSKSHTYVGQMKLSDSIRTDRDEEAYAATLFAASVMGCEKAVQLLVSSGADVNANGGAALRAAAEHGHEKTVQLLLSYRANVDAQCSAGSRDTALNLASRRGDEKILQLILDAGADFNVQGLEGNALHIASEQNHDRLVRLLINAGADVNAVRGRHTTALDIASHLDHEKVVQLLLDAGAKSPNSVHNTNVLSPTPKNYRTNTVQAESGGTNPTQRTTYRSGTPQSIQAGIPVMRSGQLWKGDLHSRYNASEYPVTSSRGETLVQSTIRQALALVATTNDSSAESTLEEALDSVWTKIRAASTTYVMTDIEFAVFNRYRSQARLQNETARKAIERYWNAQTRR